MTMNARGTGVTGELWEKLVNLENLEVQRAVELILIDFVGVHGSKSDTRRLADLATCCVCRSASSE